MDIVAIDFETFFDSKDYTLKKLTTEEYVRDPRFEPLCVAIKINEAQAQCFPKTDIEFALSTVDWDNAFVVAHHMQFDGLILSHHYNIIPAAYGCTIAMGTILHPPSQSMSLAALLKLYNLEEKSVPYHAFDGKHWEELDIWTRHQLMEGCSHDVEQMATLFDIFAEGFPSNQFRIIDQTIRQFTRPLLVGDIPMLVGIWKTEEQKKFDAKQILGVTDTQLQSNKQFKALLEEAGVEVAEKRGKNGSIPAFAKNDEFMLDLLQHDDEYVRTLAMGRLGVKSTQLQTRAQGVGEMAERGPLCLYSRYAGTITHRNAGGDRLNWYNLKRDSPIRRSVEAPEGYLIAPIDFSQIECRMLLWLADEHAALEEFKLGLDPYIGIASEFYGREITKADKQERGVGKQIVLSCGYMSGWKKAQQTAKAGTYGPPVILSDDEAKRAVKLYRDKRTGVVNFWTACKNFIEYMMSPETSYSQPWGPSSAPELLEVGPKKLQLPDKTFLQYGSVEWVNEEDEEGNLIGGEWKLMTKKGSNRLYAGSVCEHITSSLSGIVMNEAMLRIIDAGFQVTHTIYDEMWVLIPEDSHARANLDICCELARQPVSWAPGLPIDVECEHMERRYHK